MNKVVSKCINERENVWRKIRGIFVFYGYLKFIFKFICGNYNYM